MRRKEEKRFGGINLNCVQPDSAECSASWRRGRDSCSVFSRENIIRIPKNVVRGILMILLLSLPLHSVPPW